METRLVKSKQLKRVLPKNKDICFEDLFELFKIKGYVRSGYFGNVYSVAFRDDDNNYEIVPFQSMKCVRGKPEFLMKVTYDSKESRAEIRILKYIILKVVPHSPHVFLYYNHVTCKSVQFRGKYKRGVAKSSDDWTYMKSGKGLITFMEYAGITIEQYFNKTPNDTHEQLAFLFQLLYTLCVFQKVKLLHYDIYSTNVTVMDTGYKSPRIWKYVVKGKRYYVPVNRYIPVFIDFGQSEIKKKRLEVLLENNNDADMLLEMFRDYTNDMSMRTICANMLRRINTKDMIRPRYFDYTNILSDFFKVFTNKPEQKTEITWTL